MHHIFFIHSTVSGHLSCFHALAVVNSAVVNTGAHVSFIVMVFCRYICQGVGLLGPKREEIPEKRGYTYMDRCFTLSYSRSWYNTVKQLYTNNTFLRFMYILLLLLSRFSLHITKFTLLSTQFSGVSYIQQIVQPSLLCNFRSSLLLQNVLIAQRSLAVSPYFPRYLNPGNHKFASIFMDLPSLFISCQWNQTICELFLTRFFQLITASRSIHVVVYFILFYCE